MSRHPHAPRRRRAGTSLCCALIFAAATTAVAAAESGAERFARDCAVCHGADARGNGPMAGSLTIAPSNLRKLTTRAGSFPEAYVRSVVDGRDLPRAHGTVDMPIWGREYNRSLAGQGERLVKERLDALIAYLGSIQEP